MRKIFLASIFIILNGCAAMSMTEQAVPVAEKGGLTQGNALIIVTRKYESEGQAHQIEVTDNGEVVGLSGVGLKSKKDGRLKHQLIWERPAGEMNLKLTKKMLVKDAAPLKIDVKSGEVYEFEIYFSYSPYGLWLRAKES